MRLANHLELPRLALQLSVAERCLEESGAVLLAYLVDSSLKHHAAVIDERNVVAHLFHALHVVGREDDGVALIAQVEDFLFQQLGVHGVEAREGFVEDEQRGAVEQGDDELHFLLHAF